MFVKLTAKGKELEEKAANLKDVLEEIKKVKAIVAKAGAPKCAGAKCGCLAGKKLKFVLDNDGIQPPELSYEFTSADELIVTENGKTFTCAYGALSLKNIVLFAHMIPGTLRGYTACPSIQALQRLKRCGSSTIRARISTRATIP